MEIYVLTDSLLIFSLRVISATMTTVRTILLTRGQKVMSALLGFVEISLWVVAISKVLSNLDTIWGIVGYSGGFAVGILVGMAIEERLALGYSDIHVISTHKGNEVAQALRKAGYGVTLSTGYGQSGPVTMVDSVVSRKTLSDALQVIESADSNAFISVEDARRINRGYIRPGK